MPVSDLVRNLLHKRGIESEQSISAFLNPDYEAHTHSPFLLADMQKAVERIFLGLDRGERIAIYADFDCDGIPGAALLSDFFEKIGCANFEVYIPHRDREGYGFHIEAIEYLAAKGVTVVITVDVGTTAHEAIKYAQKKGVDVIVTDHHELSPEHGLPPAYAVLNPKCSGYPFPDLCGAAVAWKLVQALITEGRNRKLPRFLAVPIGWEKWLLDLVAIATVADMVPLVGENRVLVRYGMEVLRKSRRVGITALSRRLRLRKEELSEDDIGFSFAPRINAASRMDEPDLAFRLLTTRDSNEAEQLAARLEQLNTRRKASVGAIVREAKKRVRERFSREDRVVVLGNPEWKPALLGLAANSIIGERGGIVCMWGRDAKGRLKGSCRSDGALSIIDLFAAAPGAVEEYGGHKQSGGFTVSHEKVHLLQDTLSAAAENLQARESEKEVTKSDANTSLSLISIALYRDVSRLAPFGIGNPKPVFLISDTVVSSVRRFGKDNNHIELALSCARTGHEARGFDFFRSPESFTCAPLPGARVHLLATLERDSFRGGSAVALRLVDVLSE
ncbi:MAG: single-stranded-DNA-specific exonuclease RecJ [Parcubacteria group bacterium GW2011_GWA2_51_10]|nr:MAG: single-stranded-DNA-specific exonuclease RecJ [Parcubacteria group bacterium GW2011_GWA2_51_10]